MQPFLSVLLIFTLFTFFTQKIKKKLVELGDVLIVESSILLKPELHKAVAINVMRRNDAACRAEAGNIKATPCSI
jgi:hypothetical protein